ncbi:CD83 antigen-like [Echeneis naucrates]|uniref:CD83 antigen-like n=1 Tax=Echeneis naucrates TaxID=173247 RepID=A0A665U1J2_ECHNA|nr:CD83 antigen-like [Echeneis naucrates]
MFSFRLLFGLLGSLGCCRFSAAAASLSPGLEIRTESGTGRALQCTAKHKEGVQYSSVRWYKVLEPPSSRLSGLITRDLPDGVTRWYLNVTQDVKLLSDFHSLFLPNVACSDAGVYMCHLAAPVGEQNRDGTVLLTVTDCPTEKELSDIWLLCVTSGVLMFALLIFFMSYCSLKNVLKGKHKAPTKEVLNAPLGKMDLMMINTLGPKPSTKKHIWV